MARRGSTNFVPKATPYQIYHTNVESGKNVAGSKRKLCWRFGWTDSEQEHSVDLKHSLLSGKRTIFEDGREISSTQGLLSTEFSHGWESNKHIFRIEANTGVGSDHIYIFTIDGVRFEDFQRKPAHLDIPDKEEPAPVSAPSKPAASTSSSTTTKKSAFPPVESQGSFDPFSDKGSSSSNFQSDPFASSSNGNKSKGSDPFGASTQAASKPKAAEVDFFAQPAAPAPKASNVGNDFFSTPAPVVSGPSFNDDFFGSNAASAGGKKGGGMDDFSGMTYHPPAPAPMQSQQTLFHAPANQPPPPAGKPGAPAAAAPAPAAGGNDIWGGLVSLDLGPKETGPQRRASIQTGPTLNQMTTSGQPPAASVMSPTTGSPFGGSPVAPPVNAPYATQNQPGAFGVTHMGGVTGGFNNNAPNFNQAPRGGAYDPFGNSSTPITSTLGPVSSAPSINPYGPAGPVGGVALPMNTGSAISNMANPFGPGPAGGGAYGAPRGPVNPYGAPAGGMGGKPQQSSLDTLNWKM